MKIRTPGNRPLNWQAKPDSEAFSVTYTVKTITPVFGGGVDGGEVDTDMPIRAAAIRGQLRHWWRFLQTHRLDGQSLKGKKLFEAERAIWGGLKPNGESSDEKDYDAAGKVSIAVTVNQTAALISAENVKKDDEAGIKYALFSAEHDLLDAGIEFSLTLRAQKQRTGNSPSGNQATDDQHNNNPRGLTTQQWDEVLEAVRWWANFGGVGARTRRGLGAVEVAGIAPVSVDEAAQHNCTLKARSPVKGKPIKAWNQAMEKLYQFRQGKSIGRRPGSDPRVPLKLGRSYWPEPDSIRDITGRNANGKHMPDPHTRHLRPSFPRAMFGLPIIFEIRGAGEPPKTQLLPASENTSRMASPLIIKPVADGEGGYIPIALLLPTDHLARLRVSLKEIGGSERGRYGRDGDESWWPLDEDQQNARAESIEPMKKRANNPLQAFLEFFEGRTSANV